MGTVASMSRSREHVDRSSFIARLIPLSLWGNLNLVEWLISKRFSRMRKMVVQVHGLGLFLTIRSIATEMRLPHD
jgi:hypothetical protein